MIITLNETKSLIDNNSSDTSINQLIPIVEQAICDYCNTDFVDENYDFFSSGNIVFLSSDNSINLSGIENKKLVVNDTIRVYNSLRNNQAFTVSSVTTDKIIVNSINTIIDENEGKAVYITKIKYPISIKFIASQMINYNLENLTPGMKSEKIDDYTITLQNTINGYPENYMTGLQIYRQYYKKTLFNSTYARMCF